MTDVIAFYILCQVTDYLIGRRPFDSYAFWIASNLKSQIVRESSEDGHKFITVLADCRLWKETK